MRPGQPQVIAQQRAPAVAAHAPWDSLRRQLGTRNRVMLFWDSELDDAVSTRYREVETVDRSSRASAAQADGVAYTHAGPVGMTVAGASGSACSSSGASDSVIPCAVTSGRASIS